MIKRLIQWLCRLNPRYRYVPLLGGCARLWVCYRASDGRRIYSSARRTRRASQDLCDRLNQP